MHTPSHGDSAPAAQATPPPIPGRKSNRQAIVIISLAITVILACFSGTAALLIHYSAKFSTMDRTHGAFSWDPNRSSAISTSYQNSIYGLTLKLPGKWVPAAQPTKYLCHLVGPDRFNAIFELDFPVLTSSVEADAAGLKQRLQIRSGWTFNSEESTFVSGLPARIIRMTSPRGVASDILLVKKWPIVYGLEVAGPAGATEDWQRVHDALPQAIEIK